MKIAAYVRAASKVLLDRVGCANRIGAAEVVCLTRLLMHRKYQAGERIKKRFFSDLRNGTGERARADSRFGTLAVPR